MGIVEAVPATTRSETAALRAWLQGLPVEDIAGRWLAPDPDEVPTARQALATLHAVRDALVQRAHLHGREDLARACMTPGRSGIGMDRSVDAVRELEALGTPAPQAGHGVHLWLAGPLARRLQRAGVTTLGDLVALCNLRGRSWWRHVPRVGPQAAAHIVKVLDRHAGTLGQLGAHVTGAALPAVAGGSTLRPVAGIAVPLEVMQLPRELNGADGINRAPHERSVIAARDDYQAIQTWLSLWPAGSPTRRAYRKEAERFLAWIIVERGKAFSDALTDDCLAYRAFLCDPQPAACWCGPQVPRAIEVGGTMHCNPAWRPFTGSLSPRSARYAETVLASLCGWLVARRYLDSNPWEGLPKVRHVGQSIDIERAVPVDVSAALESWLDAESGISPQMRVLRAAILLLRDSGMRCFEAAAADCASLHQAEEETQSPGLWGELMIVGKGGKARHVPISTRAYQALVQHWADRGLNPGDMLSGPLLAPLSDITTPRARAKAADGRLGYSDRGLRHLVERAGRMFRAHLAQHDPQLLTAAQSLHPHAFRHAFGTFATEAGVPLDVLQAYMGHASPATSALYNKAGARRRRGEIAKLYAPAQRPARSSIVRE